MVDDQFGRAGRAQQRAQAGQRVGHAAKGHHAHGHAQLARAREERAPHLAAEAAVDLGELRAAQAHAAEPEAVERLERGEGHLGAGGRVDDPHRAEEARVPLQRRVHVLVVGAEDHVGAVPGKVVVDDERAVHARGLGTAHEAVDGRDAGEWRRGGDARGRGRVRWGGREFGAGCAERAAHVLSGSGGALPSAQSAPSVQRCRWASMRRLELASGGVMARDWSGAEIRRANSRRKSLRLSWFARPPPWIIGLRFYARF